MSFSRATGSKHRAIAAWEGLRLLRDLFQVSLSEVILLFFKIKKFTVFIKKNK